MTDARVVVLVGAAAATEAEVGEAIHDIDGLFIDAFDTTLLTSWTEAKQVFTEAFHALREAKRSGVNAVVRVHTDDGYGRRGELGAMVACGLTSATRTLAMEMRDGSVANVISDDGTASENLLATISWLLSSSAITGEVITLGRGHLGRVPV
jgi:hypothetical protein